MYRLLFNILNLFFLISLLISQVSAQDSLVYESGGELIPEQAAFDVSHYELNLRINPADSTIEGSVTVDADIVHPADVIALDLHPALSIHKITWIGWSDYSSLPFSRPENSKKAFIRFPVTLQPGESVSLNLSYSGKPRVAPNPPWNGGFVWSKTPAGEPWIAVANQTTGAWLWWPNKDHPSDKPDSVSLHFTLPESLKVASNGRLVEISTSEEGWITWSWKVLNPISNYNITVNAAPYETISDSYRSITGEEFEILFWILPSFLEEGEKLFPQFKQQIRFLEELIGPYPFRSEKYGVAHTPYLGMEHQTIVAYGARFKNDNLFGAGAGFDDLHQHELAHEWWGNLITVRDWKDFWIHEGFATYMQPLYAEKISGRDAYNRMMTLFKSRIASDEPLAPDETRTTLEITGGNRGGDIYYKGAWVLHTLRYVMGDPLFFELLQRFAYPDEQSATALNGSQVRFVSSIDFITLAEKIYGEKLNWFFDAYLKQTGLPELAAEKTGDYTFKLNWSDNGPALYHMPVEIRMDNEIKTYKIPEKGLTLQVSDKSRFEIDPQNKILMNKPHL